MNMAKKLSAGLLLHRISEGGVLEVLIVHPGGPFWAKKDDGAWSIPKGEYDEDEDPKATALREFEEEIGLQVPDGSIEELGSVKQPSGKLITAFAMRADLDIADFKSNEFEMEWPRKSGKMQSFPEVDRAAWFEVAAARRKLLKGHGPFLDKLLAQLRGGGEQIDEGSVDEPVQGSLFE